MNPDNEIQLSTNEAFGKMLLFMRQYPHICYANWPLPALANWLAWCCANDALRFTFAPGPNGFEVTGLAVYWRMRSKDWHHKHFLDQPWQFALQKHDGDGIYLDMILARPGTVGILVADGQWRNPEWRGLKFAAKRHGKLKEYHSAEKFFARLEGL